MKNNCISFWFQFSYSHCTLFLHWEIIHHLPYLFIEFMLSWILCDAKKKRTVAAVIKSALKSGSSKIASETYTIIILINLSFQYYFFFHQKCRPLSILPVVTFWKWEIEDVLNIGLLLASNCLPLLAAPNIYKDASYCVKVKFTSWVSILLYWNFVIIFLFLTFSSSWCQLSCADFYSFAFKRKQYERQFQSFSTTHAAKCIFLSLNVWQMQHSSNKKMFLWRCM